MITSSGVQALNLKLEHSALHVHLGGEVAGERLSGQLAEASKTAAKDLGNGGELSKSLKKYPGIFSPAFVHMIDVGEATGELDTTLSRLAERK